MNMNTFFASAIFMTSLLLILSACRSEKTARSTQEKTEAVPEQSISLSETLQTEVPEPVEEAIIETEIEIVQQEQEYNETDYYALAYEELARMLSGARKPDFERAVFVSENPYHDQAYRYEDFQATIDLYEYRVRQLVRANDRSDTLRLDASADADGYFRLADLRYLPEEKKELYRQALSNWAIFAYLTDTTVFYSREHAPFRYAGEDPFGQKDWSHSQVIGLLRSEDGRGNCFALTALYKILSDRLEAGARICTAPQHIYIQHQDPKGHYYNVELATAGHPGDGTIQTLTHTPSEAIRSGIALRTYNEQQAIGLCLVHLAKSYERHYGLKDADFMEQCADLVLSHDSLNLNAILLKQQILDTRLKNYALQKGTSHIATLRKDPAIAPLIVRLESHLGRLKELGYRQMPVEMQKIILSGEFPAQFTNQNPSPFTTIDPKDEHRKKFHTMYGGLFQEVFVPREQETYGHVVYSSKTKGIVTLDTAAGSDFLIDPVAFAYDFGARMYDARLGRWLSVDPYKEKYPSFSPYHSFANNPILIIDTEGKYNTIYLVIAKDNQGNAKLTNEDAVAIAAQANEYLKLMGLETRVVFFDEDIRGEFNVENIDYTDNVAVVGNSPAAIVHTMNKVSPAFADRIDGTSFTEGKGANATNPEKSNNRQGGLAVGNRLGIAVRTDEALSNLYAGTGLNTIESAAISIIHGAGHNTYEINDAVSMWSKMKGHTSYGLMADGNDVRNELIRGGINRLLDIRNKDNQLYIEGVNKRYGTQASQDNYDSNKENIGCGQCDPAYNRE